MVDPESANDQFMRDHIRLLGLRLQREVANAGTTPSAAVPLGPPLQPATPPSSNDEMRLAEELERRRELHAGLPIARLARSFCLLSAACDLLLVLVAGASDERFSRIYGHLHGDRTKHWLTFGLALRLLQISPHSSTAFQLFRGPLVESELIHVTSSASGVPLPPLERPIAIDDRIYDYLLGNDVIDARLSEFVTRSTEPQEPPEGQFVPAVMRTLANLALLLRVENAPAAWLHGPSGAGKHAAARYLAAGMAKPLLSVDSSAFARADPRRTWKLLQREQQLRDAVIYIRRFDQLDETIRAELQIESARHLLLGADALPSLAAGQAARLEIAIPVSPHEGRVESWQRHLDARAPADLAGVLAGRFVLTKGQIEQAAIDATRLARLRGGIEANPSDDDYFEGARRQSTGGLELLATKVTSLHKWDDLILPAATSAHLRALVSQVKHAPTVYETWGFAKKLAHGKGLTALFSGPAGTGKTMSAAIIAREIGLDMYKVDLSGVVSKYIGETEKNLEQIFKQATNSNAVLFFDEADSLFGKRTEVKDAHDRYANLEVSYLLQKMDEYQGITILATNLNQNMDEAFTRRLRFVVEFPTPGPAERQPIWRGLFPPKAPLDSGVDFEFLASRFELTGGNIKNCVLGAAFAAAEAGTSIGMETLVRAVARELTKNGKPLQQTEFGDYFPLVTSARRGGSGSHPRRGN